MNINNWKKANDVYATLSHLDQVEALNKLKTIENITPAIKKIIITLISSGDQSSQYFQQHVSEDYAIKSIFQLNSWQLGQQIGDYQLLKEIGEGGMSKVFSAKRINSDVQKLVAIKIFSHSNNSAELKKRFIEEQKILSNLSHPNIITMHHGETTQSGEPYIVMELIKNAVAVDEYVKNKKLSIPDIVKIILETANALAYAHRNLIIHRDIKPTNIIISEKGMVKIVDFGIAKQISNNNDENTIMALTPSFASPEQINGNSINIYTDVFSLAAVCVAIVIEEKPLPKDRIIKSCEGDDDYVRKLLKDHKLDKDLSNILIQAIANNPNKRYNSMDKFAEDLTAWLNNETVSATPDSLMYRLSKFAKRRKSLFATILTLIVSMTIAVMVLSWQYKKTMIEAQKAQQVKQFMLDAFRVTDPNSSQGVEISAKDLLKVASDTLSENNQLEEDTKFDLHQTIAIAYGQLGFFNSAIGNIKKSLDIKPNNTKSLSLLCEYLLNIDNYEELKIQLAGIDHERISTNEDRNRILRVKIRLHALNGEIESVDLLLKNLNIDTTNIVGYIENQRLIAEIQFVKGDSANAIEIIKSVLRNIDLKPSHTLILGMNNDLIRYLNNTGQYDEALLINEKIIAQLRLILGDRHPELGNSLNQMSRTYRLKGDMINAYTAAADAQQIFFKLYGENSIGFAQSLNKLAMLDYLSGDKSKAIDGFEKTVKIYETIYSSEHLETLKVKTSLAGLYTATGKPKEAESLLRNVFQLKKMKLGDSHSSTINTQQHLARALTALNKLPEAIHHAELSYQLAKNNYADSDPVVDTAEFILAKTYFKAKEYKQALDLFLINEDKSKKDNHTYANLLWDIAKCYVALEEFEQADSYFLKSIQAYDNVYSSKHIRSLRIRLVYASFLQTQNRLTDSRQIVESVTQTYHDESHNEPRLLSMLKNLNQKLNQNH